MGSPSSFPRLICSRELPRSCNFSIQVDIENELVKSTLDFVDVRFGMLPQHDEAVVNVGALSPQPCHQTPALCTLKPKT